MESRTRRAEEQLLIDAKIAAIKKKEELIKKRQQEIEEDIRLAEEQDAVVKLKPVSDDWFPGKTSQLKLTNRVSFGEVEEMSSKQMPYRGRGKGRRHDDQRVGGPPPDPVSFLADPERDYGPSDVNAQQFNHHQPRNVRQELPRQDIPPKNLNENWRSDEKRLGAKPPKTDGLDWRGDNKLKNVENRNWREDGSGDPIRDDKNPAVKVVDMQQDWRNPGCQGRNFDSSNEGLTHYLPNPNESARDSDDLRSMLSNSRAEPKFADEDGWEGDLRSRLSNSRAEPKFSDEDGWEGDLRSRLSNSRSEPKFSDKDGWEGSLNTTAQLPPQIPEPVRQTVFDTLPSHTNLQRGFDEPDPAQNAGYYSNVKPVAGYEQVQKTANLRQVYGEETDDPVQNSVYFSNAKPAGYEQVVDSYRKESSSEDGWEGSEKFLTNHSKIPSRSEFQKDEPAAWNYYQDPARYSSGQKFEPPNPQPMKPQSHITNNGQSWNHDAQRAPDYAQNAVKNQVGSTYPVGQWNEPKPSMPYPDELQYEQVLQRSQGKPPNPVYPASYDQQPPSNQQTNVRQSSALNAGRPDDAYAYFQAKMAKAQSHQNANSEIDELQAQFSKMSAVPDRRGLSAANPQTPSMNQFQYTEMNNARQQASTNFQPQSANQYQYQYDEMNPGRQQVVNQQAHRPKEISQYDQYQYDEMNNARQVTNPQRLREAQRLREESQLVSQYQYDESSGRQPIANSQSQRLRESQFANQHQYDEMNSRQQVLNPQQQAMRLKEEALRLRELREEAQRLRESQLVNQYQFDEVSSSRPINPHQFAEMASLRQRHQATTNPQRQNVNQSQLPEMNSTRQKQPIVDANQYQFSELKNVRQAPQALSISQHQYSEMNNVRQLPPQVQNVSQHPYSDINSAQQVPQPQNVSQYTEMNSSRQLAPQVQNQSQRAYSEMGNVRQQPAYVAEQPLNVNDRLRKSREQTLDRFPAQSGFVGHGAEASCQTDEPLLMQSYQMDARHNPNINQRSHPVGVDNFTTPDGLVSTTDKYLNAQYEPARMNPSPNQYNNESRDIPRQNVDQLPLSDASWTAQNMAEMQQLAGQAAQQSSQPNWNMQPQHINDHAQQGNRNGTHVAENESLLAFQNELVAHATDRIQARVNSALNDRLKKAREAALQERFEPPPQFPPNQIPMSDQMISGQRPMGRAIKGCQPTTLPGENQQKLMPSQFDNWQEENERQVGPPSITGPPSEISDGDQQRPESVQSLLPTESEFEEPLEITLPACVDLTKPPPVIIPTAVSPAPPERFPEEITANIFSSPPPKIPELNPDSDDVDSLIAKPYYQYDESPTTNQSFRPKLTFSLEKKGLERAENSSQSTSMNSKPPLSQSDGEEVAPKRITAAERVAKLLETPVVLPDHTPSYVLKVLGEEEIRNIKSRTANPNPQNGS